MLAEDVFHGGFGEDGAVALLYHAAVGHGGDGQDDGGRGRDHGGERRVPPGEAQEAAGRPDAAGLDGLELEEAFEVGGEVAGRGVAITWTFGEGLENDRLEVAGDSGVSSRGGADLAGRPVRRARRWSGLRRGV